MRSTERVSHLRIPNPYSLSVTNYYGDTDSSVYNYARRLGRYRHGVEHSERVTSLKRLDVDLGQHGVFSQVRE